MTGVLLKFQITFSRSFRLKFAIFLVIVLSYYNWLFQTFVSLIIKSPIGKFY